MRGNLFSDSWFKVADLRVSLLPSVDIQKQYYRGELWYVIKDRFNNNYFRITPDAYAFVTLLSPDKTVQAVWEESLELYRENAPSQDDVINLLTELHVNNLLYFSNLPNNDFIFQRYEHKKKREFKAKLMSIIAIKVPLLNPDKWLDNIKPLIKVIFNPVGFLLWFAVVIWGAKTVAENFAQIYDKTQGILATDNLFLLYISLAVVKIFHELSHCMMTKKYGGQVHTVGVMFLVFTPLPFMDATSSWFFKNKMHRVLTGAAGMLSDLLFAAIAALIWASTGDGIIHSIAFNIMVIGSVSSILFNGNPLLRFDAYYIMSDVLEIPNLYQKSRQQIIYWIEKYCFKAIGCQNPSVDNVEAFWLAVYAVMSFLYRVLISISIILFVSDQIFALGLLLVVITIIVGLISPTHRIIKYLKDSPKLLKTRKRAIAMSFSFALAVFLLVAVMPFPYSVRAPGIVEAVEHINVYAETEGVLIDVFFKSGQYVKQGDVIVKLDNPELALDIAAAKAALQQTSALMHRAVFESAVDIKPLLQRQKVLTEQLNDLYERQSKLTVTAQTSGYFISQDINALKGVWIKRQAKLGSITSEKGYKFSAIVLQEQASDIFKHKGLDAEVKLYGKAQETFKLADIVVIPYQKDELPSAALGWYGGGNIAVKSSDTGGKKAAEPFFEISGFFKVPDNPHLLLHGHSGVLRVQLPSEPLGVQLVRLAKQTIQKRYKV